MFVPKFMKDDWVRKKGTSQLMQIDEYQTEIVAEMLSGKKTSDHAHRQYNGKVWCTWSNENNHVVSEPFLESELEEINK
ncbi:hypothetical protein SAMN04487995_2955 [Dyadobacter koreensis]|uniref:Uncharacterized protein n=1 Tax=Dyadobacter koreensis TaxID=408657 RepID=A0A1H6VHT8_9BACT|nr:hypothetical protein [Dyadobacter koreensis]SEI99892.1 hypothetical protein SAMN04487995_2955 [Dyadobacter koreensis]